MDKDIKILALEPYYSGSHKAFLDGWSKNSKHKWTIFTLAGYKWKWRMRHSAITFADEVVHRISDGEKWDVIFCSDMLNLAEFLGLSPKSIRELPSIAYFHENQLTYPVQFESERDFQFAMTNITTALAANQVWFNSDFHRNCFCQALENFLKKMPDYQPKNVGKKILQKSFVYPPGINDIKYGSERKSGPLRILWAARAEHDKNPDDFFKALKILKKSGTNFRLSVVGQQFREIPEIFGWAKEYFADHIDNWGYQENREKYEQLLAGTDVFVSTANHEFFGISCVEAITAGAYPVLPNRLAYPEILNLEKNTAADKFFYNGTVPALADKLNTLAKKADNNSLWDKNRNEASLLTERFKWKNLAKSLDNAIEFICK